LDCSAFEEEEEEEYEEEKEEEEDRQLYNFPLFLSHVL
jgi:hypothetical protein